MMAYWVNFDIIFQSGCVVTIPAAILFKFPLNYRNLVSNDILSDWSLVDFGLLCSSLSTSAAEGVYLSTARSMPARVPSLNCQHFTYCLDKLPVPFPAVKPLVWPLFSSTSVPWQVMLDIEVCLTWAWLYIEQTVSKLSFADSSPAGDPVDSDPFKPNGTSTRVLSWTDGLIHQELRYPWWTLTVFTSLACSGPVHHNTILYSLNHILGAFCHPWPSLCFGPLGLWSVSG